MEIKISYNHGNEELVLSQVTNVDNLYQFVGKLLLEEIDRKALPSQITATSDCGLCAEWTVKKRGYYVKNGTSIPSLYVTCERDDFWDFRLNTGTHYPHVFLTCINPESNNYKYYEMEDTYSKISAHYGRINATSNEKFGKRSTVFDRNMYWIRYYEKLSKGYLDQSEIYLDKAYQPKPEDTSYAVRNDSNEAIALFDRLYRFANQYVNQQTTTFARKPTEKQVKLAGELLAKLGQEQNIDQFNVILKQLLVLIPRNIGLSYENNTKSFFATTDCEFPTILKRERNLYRAMKGISTTAGKTDTFKNHNILVRMATEKQKEEVLSHMEESEKRQVKNIYRVIPRAQKKRFNAYCKAHNITVVKELWHGSTNENWLSIIETSLNMYHTCANGSMFGQGLYFAPSSNKSQGYTSNYGSYWSHGKSSTYYMGLFATAFGTPLMVRNSGYYTAEDMKKNGTDCVYAASRNTGLRRDEVIFYDNDAVLLNYIVEFENC